MAEIDYGIDPELVFEFVDESQEMLSEVANMFISLESNPTDKEAIDKIFRTVHTIKGNSAFFNLMKVKSMSHIMEDLMNLVRDGAVGYSKTISDVLIRGIDALKQILENVRAQKAEVDDQSSYDSLLAEITSQVDIGRQTDPATIWKALTKDVSIFKSGFKTEDPSLLTSWDRILKSLSQLNPLSGKKEEEKKGAVESIKPADPKALIESILSKELENNLDDATAEQILNSLEELKNLVTDASIALIDEAIASYQKTVPHEGFTPFLAEIITTKLEKAELKQKGMSAENEDEKKEQAEEKEAVSAKSKKTMRIYESSLDKFLDFVGELVVVGEMYGHIQKRFTEQLGQNKDVANLKKNNELFNDLSTVLQKSVLDIRRIPIKSLLQRAPRIVHDIANEKNKKINIELRGEETLIDKSLLESLEGPFVHMIRNAADHGIETTQERTEKNKKEEGTILINVTEDDATLFITIKDDGKGIDRVVILEKAISKGLVGRDQSENLTDQEVYNFLFAPGFSTAKEVTDVSGRGVGMDVVKRSIEAIGGQIVIESVLNEGSTFTLEAPRAVAVNIIHGFLVKSAKNKFVLPMKSVGESFVIKDEQVTEIFKNGQKCILHHNKVFPTVRLDELFNIRKEKEEDFQNEYVGVIIRTAQKNIVLIVDDVLGTQQVVIKDIEGLPSQSQFISGGAILGDERVAIVLDLDDLNS